MKDLFVLYGSVCILLTGLIFWVCWPTKSSDDTNPFS